MRFKLNALLLFFSAAINSFHTLDVSAQQVPNIQNLSTLNIDELTDDQVKKFMAQVQSSGYTEDQLLILARARGMSELQIQKLRARIEALQNTASGNQSSDGINRLREMPRLKSQDTEPHAYDPFSIIFPEDTLVQQDELEIFGLSFFKKGQALFEPSINVPTPQNYVLGPGDGIVIDIWGASEYSYDNVVSPEGVIKIQGIGPIYVSGLTIKDASEKIRGRLKSIFSSLGRNVFADISLGKLRTISVNVVGEVVTPGTYTTSSFATAFNVLYMAGGPNKNGSLRYIDIFREGKKLKTLDAYNYLIKGSGGDIMLHDQDVVLIRPYSSRIELTGEIKRPAIYEMLETETLSDLLEYAGGFTGNAYSDRISLRRNQGNFKAISTVEKSDFDHFILTNGDVIEVKQASNLYANRVSIQGAVFQEGEYGLKNNPTVKTLLKNAGGLRGDAFLGRAVILRQNEDFSLTSEAFNLKDLLGDSIDDIDLKNEDILRIESIYDLREEFLVEVRGEVLKPGRYVFIKGQTVEDLILLAGGFMESAAKSFVEVARRNTTDSVGKGESSASQIFNFKINSSLTLDEHASSFELKPYDLVVIRRSPFYEEQIMVEVTGEVKYPGTYALENKNDRISDVLLRSGGVTAYGYPQGASLIRRTEYYRGDNYGSGSELSKKEREAAKIRKEEIKSLLMRDTLLEKQDIVLKERESIGIDLTKILEHPGSEYDLIMNHGDILNIPRELQTVRIRGEVLYPSNLRFSKSLSFSDFISGAGGFSDNAMRSKSYVIYPRGTAQRTKSFLWFKKYPKLEPGAEIIVPEKPQRRRLSPTEIVAVLSGIGTLALVINNISGP